MNTIVVAGWFLFAILHLLPSFHLNDNNCSTDAFTPTVASLWSCRPWTTIQNVSPHSGTMTRHHHHHHHRTSPSVVVLPAAATSIQEITAEAADRMSKSIDSVKLSLTSIRTGRASSSILDRVKIDYYGTMTPLNQVASIAVPSAQQLTVDPYEKTILSDIEKAIVLADIGLTPSNDGSIIRINIPPLTEDRRKDLLKQCKQLGEEGKVALRNVRRDGVDTVKKMEKAGTVGEDEMKDGLDVMQKMTDKSVKEIDEIVAKKEKEVMTV
jgi:ribosome recycling factor